MTAGDQDLQASVVEAMSLSMDRFGIIREENERMSRTTHEPTDGPLGPAQSHVGGRAVYWMRCPECDWCGGYVEVDECRMCTRRREVSIDWGLAGVPAAPRMVPFEDQRAAVATIMLGGLTALRAIAAEIRVVGGPVARPHGR